MKSKEELEHEREFTSIIRARVAGRGLKLKLKSFSKGRGERREIKYSVDKCINANLGDIEVGMRMDKNFD